jgi:hypothetical protein
LISSHLDDLVLKFHLEEGTKDCKQIHLNLIATNHKSPTMSTQCDSQGTQIGHGSIFSSAPSSVQQAASVKAHQVSLEADISQIQGRPSDTQVLSVVGIK